MLWNEGLGRDLEQKKDLAGKALVKNDLAGSSFIRMIWPVNPAPNLAALTVTPPAMLNSRLCDFRSVSSCRALLCCRRRLSKYEARCTFSCCGLAGHRYYNEREPGLGRVRLASPLGRNLAELVVLEFRPWYIVLYEACRVGSV